MKMCDTSVKWFISLWAKIIVTSQFLIIYFLKKRE